MSDLQGVQHWQTGQVFNRRYHVVAEIECVKLLHVLKVFDDPDEVLLEVEASHLQLVVEVLYFPDAVTL